MTSPTRLPNPAGLPFLRAMRTRGMVDSLEYRGALRHARLKFLARRLRLPRSTVPGRREIAPQDTHIRAAGKRLVPEPELANQFQHAGVGRCDVGKQA